MTLNYGSFGKTKRGSERGAGISRASLGSDTGRLSDAVEGAL